MELTELGEQKMEVGEVQVGGVAHDRCERNEMIAEPMGLEPVLDRCQEDLAVQPLLGSQRLGGDCRQGIASWNRADPARPHRPRPTESSSRSLNR